MRLMRAFAPAMAERGWGRIVNVASVGRQAAVADQRRLFRHQGRRSSRSRACSPTPRRPRRARQRDRPGRGRGPLWMAEGGLGDQTAAAKGPPARRRWRRRRPRSRSGASRPRRRSRTSSSSSAPSAPRSSPAPPGRSTAARLQPSSELGDNRTIRQPLASETCTSVPWSPPAAAGPARRRPELPPGAPTVLIERHARRHDGRHVPLHRPARQHREGVDEGADRASPPPAWATRRRTAARSSPAADGDDQQPLQLTRSARRHRVDSVELGAIFPGHGGVAQLSAGHGPVGDLALLHRAARRGAQRLDGLLAQVLRGERPVLDVLAAQQAAACAGPPRAREQRDQQRRGRAEATDGATEIPP